MPLSDVLSDGEVARRVSILKRFRELLTEQRDRFRVYLGTLESQKNVIEDCGVDEITAHVELEEKILADIYSLEKSIEPMRALYTMVWKDTDPPDVAELNTALSNLKIEAARRANENKMLIQKRLGTLRTEIKNHAANPFQRSRRAIQAEYAQANFLDIKG